ncbi:hypothetical protein CL622_03820 [archaeon]|nr:hypothetical protein [archaeon]
MYSESLSPHEFVEQYWGPVRLFTSDEDHSKYWEQLEQKYGEAFIEEYLDLVEKNQGQFSDFNDYLALEDFCHKHNVLDTFVPETSLRQKNTLLSIINNLCDVQGDFTFAELGSGSSHISIGLALYFDNLKKGYTVDALESAIDATKRNIDKRSRDEKEVLENKLVPIEGDFTDFGYHTDNPIPEAVDVTYIGFFNCGIHNVLNTIQVVAREEGRVIIGAPYIHQEELTYEQHHQDMVSEEIKDGVEWMLSHIASEAGPMVNFEKVEPIKWTQFFSGALFYGRKNI